MDETGTLYGTTAGNGRGAEPTGTVWKLPPGGGLQMLHVFANGTDGEQPDQVPTLGPDGTVYGTTHRQNDGDFEGAIWKLTPAGVFTTLHDFAGATDGALPNGPLILGKDGNLYGTTEGGGPNGVGTLFRITPAGVFTVIHAFAGDTDGATPTGDLAVDNDGAIYGGLQSGQIFRIAP